MVCVEAKRFPFSAPVRNCARASMAPSRTPRRAPRKPAPTLAERPQAPNRCGCGRPGAVLTCASPASRTADASSASARPRDAERRRRLVLLRGAATRSVMLNRYPYNNGHLMIAPRRHRRLARTARAAERAALGRAAGRGGDAARGARSTATASTSAPISGAAPARDSPIICTGTSCRDGTATPTSCRCWRPPA